MIIIEKADLSQIDNINPNFTPRRFDFSYPDTTELLKIYDDKQIHYIPFVTNGKSADISVELTEISDDFFQELIKWIFKNYKKVKKISFTESLNNCKKNTFSYSAIAYKTILPNTPEEYLMSLNSSVRYSYGAKQRRLKKAYTNVEFKKHETIDDELIQKYFELKTLTHKKNYELSPKEYVKTYHITTAYELCADNETAAIVLMSGINQNLYLENVTYNKKFGKYSPGITLIIYMILDSIENSEYKNIFWGAYNDYKKHLSNKTYKVYYGVVYRSALSYNFKKISDFVFKTKRENGRKIFILFGIPINSQNKKLD